MADTDTRANVGWGRKARDIVGWIVGAGVGVYAGIHLLVPLGFTAATWWGGKKLLGSETRPYLPAIAVQAGHLLWLSMGLLIIGVLDLSAIDVLVLAVGITWLLLKPNLGAIIFLTFYQVVGLAVNGVSFPEQVVGSTLHKALVVHVIWRLMALFLMWQAYLHSRKMVAIEIRNAGS